MRRDCAALVLAGLLTATAASAEPGVKRGWIGLGGRNAFGPPGAIDADFGAELIGGAWSSNEHVQVMLKAGWSTGIGAEFAINAARLGFALVLGSSFREGRLWLGGAVWATAVAAWASGPVAVSPSQASGVEIALLGVVQGRLFRRVLVGVEFGPELIDPRLRFQGPVDHRSWGPIRFNAGLRLGIILGEPIGGRSPD